MPHGFREIGGIGVAVGRDGALPFANRGNHRLGIAQALGLAAIRVAVTAVHPGSLANGRREVILRRSRRIADMPSVRAASPGPGAPGPPA